MASPADQDDIDPFWEELASLGFQPVQADRKGTVQYARRPNRFLTEWIHDDGAELLFTWEFDLGEFCESVGWQIGAAETSFQILFPQYDVKIARDLEAVAVEVQRLENQMRGLDLSDPSL
ncbi:hypothetical protein [Euzebya tangerina]|uniref:hypothetical protein n=1 Tax=Euzebya tangerina TaxID=591198 RepID=UPI0013C2A073|nr:hypothetical protein [Euzebya tangerina]